MKNLYILLGCLYLFVATPANSWAQNDLSAEVKEEIDLLFAEFENQPGCALGIFSKGKVLYQKGYGMANLAYDVPITPNTVFETASLSKHITAACILLLENAGKLSVEDPIQKYLPEIPVYEQGEIRIRHLLHHTSGLREYLKLLYVKGQSWNDNHSNSKVLTLLSRQKEINFVPGSRYAYSNTNYQLLGQIVERVSEKSLGQFAKEYIFEPLGMKQSFYYEDNRRIIPNRAIGYEAERSSYKREHYVNSTVSGDGGFHTSIEDFFKWNENFKSSKIGDDTFLEKLLQRGRLNNGEEISYASGLILGDYEGLASVGHDGMWGGFRSLYFAFPEEDISFVLLGNNTSLDVWTKLRSLSSLLLDEEMATANHATAAGPVPEAPAKIHLAQSTLKKYVGDYFNYLNGYSRSILLEEDTLVYRRPGGRDTKLIPVAENAFTFLGIPQVRLTFSDKSPGATQLVVDIEGQTPIELESYQAKQYKEEELSRFLGSYYCDELELTYRVAQKKDALAIYVGENELLQLESVMENIFNEEHFGYVKFGQRADGLIDHFTINDELVKNIRFNKILNS